MAHANYSKIYLRGAESEDMRTIVVDNKEMELRGECEKYPILLCYKAYHFYDDPKRNPNPALNIIAILYGDIEYLKIPKGHPGRKMTDIPDGDLIVEKSELQNNQIYFSCSHIYRGKERLSPQKKEEIKCELNRRLNETINLFIQPTTQNEIAK
jgi:hypothetical protein